MLAKLTLRQAYYLLLLGIGLIGLSHWGDQMLGRPYWPITQALFLGFENNVPTWYSSLLLFSASMLAFACYRECVIRGLRPNLGWLMLAGVLVVMSCDEVASLHENFGGYLSQAIAPATSARWRHTRWPIVLGPMLLLLGVGLGGYLYFHVAKAKSTGVLLLAGAGVLFGSGVALESTINWLDHEELQWLWELEILVEECGEMLGGWLMGFGLLLHYEHLREAPSSFPRTVAPTTGPDAL